MYKCDLWLIILTLVNSLTAGVTGSFEGGGGGGGQRKGRHTGKKVTLRLMNRYTAGLVDTVNWSETGQNSYLNVISGWWTW